MSATIEVEARVLGRRSASLQRHALAVSYEAGESLTLASMIAAVVRAEVTAYQGRAEENSFVRLLTERQIDAAAETGKVGVGEVEGATGVDIDVDDAIATALTAFEDGLFQVVVDDQPIESLAAEIDLRPGAHLLFLRLVALAGG